MSGYEVERANEVQTTIVAPRPLKISSPKDTISPKRRSKQDSQYSDASSELNTIFGDDRQSKKDIQTPVVELPLPTPVARAMNPIDRNSVFEKQNESGLFQKIRKLKPNAHGLLKKKANPQIVRIIKPQPHVHLPPQNSPPKANLLYNDDNNNTETREKEDFETKRSRSRSLPESKVLNSF